MVLFVGLFWLLVGGVGSCACFDWVGLLDCCGGCFGCLSGLLRWVC